MFSGVLSKVYDDDDDDPSVFGQLFHPVFAPRFLHIYLSPHLTRMQKRGRITGRLHLLP